jgi:pilus assembly protein CpaB
MAIAVVCATIASAAVLLAIRSRGPVKSPEEKGPVVVAARTVPVGIALTKDDVKVIQWPSKDPLAGAYQDVSKVVGRALKATVYENEPLTDIKLALREEKTGILPVIQKNKRAISVKVNEVIGVAGFVVPGAKVDVIVTVRQDNGSMSRVVVSNVEVLAAGTGIDQEKTKDGKPMPATVVTLMVTPEQGERVALAAAEGQILLTLRNPLDTAETKTSGVSTPELMSGPRQLVSPPQAAAPRAPVGYRVEYIRKGQSSQGVAR